MSHNGAPSIFPLPLTVFEDYLRLDDRPAYPMTIPVEIEFLGEVLPAEFEAACEEAIQRHPLFSCLLDTATKPLPSWKYCPEARSPIDWGGLEKPRLCPNGEQIDLTREAGIRVWVRSGEGRTVVTLQCHHSVCDGIGVFRFIGDLLGAYGIRTVEPGGSLTKLPPVKADRLLRRGQFPFQPPEPITRIQAARATLREAILWFWRRPAPLGVPPSSRRATFTAIPFPGMLAHRFSRAETDRLRQVARHNKVSLNDLLTRDVFLAIRDWNARLGPQPPGDWLRVNMPVSLRSGIHEAMPATNVMSYTFLTRRVADCVDPEQMLRSIHWETEIIKRWNLGLYFIGGLSVAHKIPGLVRLFTNSRRCFCTAVHSHMGDLHRRFGVQFPEREGYLVIGNLMLQRLTATPPIRPNTRAAFFTSHFAGQLTAALRCDPHLFSLDDGQRLLDDYVRRLHTSAGPPHET